MEEIHETAKVYYRKLAETQKQRAKKMFKSMDVNGDGSVSLSEYLDVLGKKGYKSCNNRNFFAELDRNGDGNLDFEEFMSLYYLIKSQRLLFCDGHDCGAFLKGIYFTCVHCFRRQNDVSFDLCSACFNAKNYEHPHATFLDNFALLSLMGAGYSNKSEGADHEGDYKALEMGFDITESIIEISTNGDCRIL